MLIHLDWKFWVSVCVVFVLIRLRPSVPRTTWFGLLNVLPLAALLGWAGLALIAAFSGALWSGLSIAHRSASKFPRVPYVLVALLIGLLLIGQKILFEMTSSGGVAAEAASKAALYLLQLVAFSYVALRAWDVTDSVHRGKTLLAPVALSGFLAPFFMMPAGPVNVYADHLEMDHAPPETISWSWFVDGVELIVCGLFVKLCLAEILRLFVVGANGDWPTASVLHSALTFGFIFLDFWGYSLVALGIGALLGVATPVNFDRPLSSKSLTEFWGRWHMSLGEFVRRLVYFPLQLALLRRTGGSYAHLVNTLSLAAAFVFVGLWHRFTLPFLLWGVLFAIILTLEKIVREVGGSLFERAWFNRAAKVLGPLYVISIVVCMLHLTAMAQMVGAKQ